MVWRNILDEKGVFSEALEVLDTSKDKLDNAIVVRKPGEVQII